MKREDWVALLLAFAFAAISPPRVSAQADELISLGDLARAVRKSKEPAAPVVIDNDNLSRIMDEVENHRLNGKPVISVDSAENRFRMSSPDGTCSLSFNADAASLITVPYLAEELPQSELAKLEGPAKIEADRLQVTLFNGTDWNVKEITIGLTIVRRVENAQAYGAARLLPAIAQDSPAQENPVLAEKPSDHTLLFHWKGTAAPLATTILRETLNATLEQEQEWHWAIVSAKGIAPSPLSLPAAELQFSSPQIFP